MAVQSRDHIKRVVSFIGTTTPTRGCGTPRGQSTIELLVIVAVALVILAVLVDFTSQQVSYLQKQQAAKTAELAIETMVNTADELYTQGPGASRYLQLTWPDGVISSGTYIQNHSIVLNVYDTQVSGTAVPLLTGSLPTHSGLQNIRIRAFDGFVAIGELDLSSSPSFILSSLSRDTNSSERVTITNLSSDDATLSIASDWNTTHSDVNVLLSAYTGTIDAGSTFSFDVNFLAGSAAVGSYTEKITVVATFPAKVESLSIPIQVNVNTGNPSQLVAFPSTLSLSTFGIDTNSTTFQLCNVGTTDMKTLSITSSTNTSAMSWLSGFPTIDTLYAQSCQFIDANLSVPTDDIGNYSGYLFVSDYTGVNTLTLPVSISVLGMSSVFSWDWSPAIRSVQSIFDFSLSNVGRKSITVSQITMRDWTLCDQQQSLWNSLVVNGTARFVGSLSDGNTADITDFTIPVLTSYTNNSLSFSDDIQDNDEPFVAVVDFSDGTQYLSSTFGTVCGPDVNAPSIVSDLTLLPGPEPESMVLSFTFPGDDGNAGRVYDINMRVSQTVIDSQAAFDAAAVLSYSGTSPFPMGGTAYTQTLSDFDVGEWWWVSVQAVDENGNRAAISNAPISKPWNEFRFSGNDFNFSNFAVSASVPGADDVNTFQLHSFSLPAATVRQLVLSVEDVSLPANSWIISLDMNATAITRATIWDAEDPSSNFWAAVPDFNDAVDIPLSGAVDMLSSTNFRTNYRYNGIQVGLSQPLVFRVHNAYNITDFNLAFDMSSSGGGGPYNP